MMAALIWYYYPTTGADEMNEMVKRNGTLPNVNTDAANIAEAAQSDAGFDKLMKFRKGHYYVDGEEIPLGSEFVAHAVGWTKTWIKFVNGNVVERKIYRMIRRETPPDRDQLDDNDPAKWAISEINRLPQDPWVHQYLLPLESADGDFCIFVASSIGGKRAVADLCAAWARKAQRDPNCGQPVIHLREVMMPSKRFGDVPRPQFEIVGWDGGVKEAVRDLKAENIRGDMDDEIPF